MTTETKMATEDKSKAWKQLIQKWILKSQSDYKPKSHRRKILNEIKTDSEFLLEACSNKALALINHLKNYIP